RSGRGCLVVAKDRSHVRDKSFDLAGLGHDSCKTLRSNQDESNERHHLHTGRKYVIGFLPLDRAGEQQDSQTNYGTDQKAIGFKTHGLHGNLNHESCDDSNQCDAYLVGRNFLAIRLFTQWAIFVDTWLAVADKYRNEQARHHACCWDSHGMNDVDVGGVQAGFVDVEQQNVVQEDGAETYGHKHISGDQTESQHGSNQAAVEAELVKDREQWWNNERDECNVNRDYVLAHNCHSQ